MCISKLSAKHEFDTWKDRQQRLYLDGVLSKEDYDNIRSTTFEMFCSYYGYEIDLSQEKELLTNEFYRILMDLALQIAYNQDKSDTEQKFLNYINEHIVENDDCVMSEDDR